MTNKESEIIKRLCSEFHKRLNGDSWRVESQVMYANNNRRYCFDLVIKYKDDVQAIFEFKTHEKTRQFKYAIIKQCNTYRELFPQSLPIIYVTDGKEFHEVSDEGKTDWGEKECIENVIEKIYKRKDNNKKPDYQSFINKLKVFSNEKVKEFAKTIEDGNRDVFFDVAANTFSLTNEYENLLFEALLGNAPDILFRYTSLDSIIRLLSEKKHSMTSLLGMTDFTECYYADNYVKGVTNMDADDIAAAYRNATICFILSCSKNKNENLKMWEDYGDKFKGVRIRYKRRDKSTNNNIKILPVSYATSNGKHPKLDFIAQIQQKYGNYTFKIRMWNIWQHFFKPYDYRDEEEIRVLYSCEDLQDEKGLKDDAWRWINKDGKLFPLLLFKSDEFPYTIREIMLGPRDADLYERNKAVLEQMILVKKADIKVIPSKYNKKDKD